MDEKQAITALGALAQETRLRTYRLLLVQGPQGLPAGEIARSLGTPSNTMSTHLAILTRAGLLKSRREGRVVFYAVELAGIRDLIGFLAEDCCAAAPGTSAPLLDSALPLTTCPAPAGCQPGDPA
jgi:DNA-binding transcriptional ArsR family regulator